MREFDVVTPPFAMSAADLWTLRMDLGWDEYFAELDGQTLALVSLDEGAESSCARVLELTYIKNPLPEWLQRTAGQEKLSFSLQQSFTKDAWDPAHPYEYTTVFPFLNLRRAATEEEAQGGTCDHCTADRYQCEPARHPEPEEGEESGPAQGRAGALPLHFTFRI